jgi:hypothetical protein
VRGIGYRNGSIAFSSTNAFSPNSFNVARLQSRAVEGESRPYPRPPRTKVYLIKEYTFYQPFSFSSHCIFQSMAPAIGIRSYLHTLSAIMAASHNTEQSYNDVTLTKLKNTRRKSSPHVVREDTHLVMLDPSRQGTRLRKTAGALCLTAWRMAETASIELENVRLELWIKVEVDHLPIMSSTRTETWL